MKEFFWLCSGACIPLLKKSPTEHTRYAGIGATIFFTGLLAAVSSGYALYSVFESKGYAIIFGLIWGCMIFNLDRFIVLSMRKSDKKYQEAFQAFPRIVLAILIAMVISKPLEIKIFDKEIQSELRLLKQEIIMEQETMVRKRYYSASDSIQRHIVSLKAEISSKQNIRDILFQIAQKEADGTGGSKRRNAGPIYRIKEKDALRVQKELDALVVKNNALIVKAETALNEIQNNKLRSFEKLTEPDIDGISFKLTALDRLAQKYQAIWLANWFIMMLFIIIEITPILTKLISPTGPYDHLLETREHFYSNYKKEKMTKSDRALEYVLNQS